MRSFDGIKWDVLMAVDSRGSLSKVELAELLGYRIHCLYPAARDLQNAGLINVDKFHNIEKKGMDYILSITERGRFCVHHMKTATAYLTEGKEVF